MSEPTQPTPPPRPSAEALDASVRLARLRRQMFARVETPFIAQYHVLRPIGGGGMGLVFAAWDPSLDRVIAIKVLRNPWSSSAGHVLRREAMALARLRHPNVVAVFEVGEHDGQVYLAMEYVEGKTLRAWVGEWRQAAKRDLDALLGVFQQAATGLAAAHAAGLVHRDVKPENVMIDGEGRVRLMDFGLARPSARATPTQDAPPSAATAESTTESMGLAGTPAYMAPEQFEGLTPGPAADQFALCACLFEALYGRRARPERMETAAAMADTPIALPVDPRVPRRLQALLRRGLALDPTRRWPSMAALADALGRLRRPRWGRWASLGGALLSAGGVAAGIALGQPGDAACTGSAARMAGVWDDARAEVLAGSVADNPAPFAADAWARLQPELDGYRSQWIATHRETCEATQLRRELSTEQMDLRMACLDDRRRNLDALLDVIEAGGAESLALAEQGTLALPPIDACSDARYVARQGYDRDATAGSEQIDGLLAHTAAQLAAGDPEAARATAADALAQAESLGDDVAIARAQLALGKAQQTLSEIVAAHDSVVTAYEHARREHLDDVAAEAATVLVRLGGLRSRFDEGLWWLRIAELDGAELDDPEIAARRELAAAALLESAGRPQQALARAERARDLLRERVGVDDRNFVSAQLEVGKQLLGGGDVERGASVITEAAVALRTALGPDHPGNARAEILLANAARMRGDFPTAIAHSERALTLTESAVGPDHIALAPYLESLALGLNHADRRDEALAVLDRALALRRPRAPHEVVLARLHGRRAEFLASFDPARSLIAYELAWAMSRAALGEGHRTTVRYLLGKGSALGAVGREAEAVEAITTALIVGRSTLGDEHPEVGTAHLALALAYERQGKYTLALEHHLSRLELLRRLHGDEAYALVGAHNNACVAFIRTERAEEALTHCRRALAIAQVAPGGSASLTAELHNSLGGVLAMLARNDEAIAAFEASRAAWRSALGPDSLEETTAITNLGELAERAGDRPKACAYYREALSIEQRHLGADDPELAETRARLTVCRG